MPHDLKTYGPWAIAAGASSGIGEAFSRLLAAEGINLILVARRMKRLEQLGAQLSSKQGIETRATNFDRSQTGAIEKVQPSASDLDVGPVVSNAGWSQMGNWPNILAAR